MDCNISLLVYEQVILKLLDYMSIIVESST